MLLLLLLLLLLLAAACLQKLHMTRFSFIIFIPRQFRSEYERPRIVLVHPPPPPSPHHHHLLLLVTPLPSHSLILPASGSNPPRSPGCQSMPPEPRLCALGPIPPQSSPCLCPTAKSPLRSSSPCVAPSTVRSNPSIETGFGN
jgi:hypothetical protein